MNERPPIVIVTARELEFQAVRDRLSGARPSRPVVGTRFEVGSLDEGEVVLAVAGQGTHSTAVLAERAIRVFSPSAVFFVGVAGSLKRSLRLGDVVFATHIYAGHGGSAWTVDQRLEHTARHIARRDFPGAGGPAVHFGPVVAGEIMHDEALAVETQYAGVARAGELSLAPVAVIRALGDRADTAAAFALALATGILGRMKRAPQAEWPPPGIHLESLGTDRAAGRAHIDRGRC